MDTNKSKKTGKIRAQNSQKILLAAESEFVKHGYKGTSLQRIADAAELPKANLLYYFSNKAKLYNALLESIVQRWDEFFNDITEEDDPKETLEAYIRLKIKQAIDYPTPSKIFTTEIIQGAPNMSDDLRHYVHSNLKTSNKIIESWIEQGKMNEVDPEQLFFLIWSSTQFYADFETQILMIRGNKKYQPEDINRISNFLCHTILSGCGLTASHPLSKKK